MLKRRKRGLLVPRITFRHSFVIRHSSFVTFCDLLLLKLPVPNHEQDDESREKRGELQLSRKLRPVIEVTIGDAEDAAEHQPRANSLDAQECANDDRNKAERHGDCEKMLLEHFLSGFILRILLLILRRI